MKLTKCTFLFVVFIYMSISFVFAQSNVKANDKTIAHLEKFRLDYIKCMLEAKPKLIASYFSEDIRLMPEFQKTIFSKTNTIAYYEAFFERFLIQEYSREKIEILDLGTRIIEHGLFTIKMVLKNTKQEYKLLGKYQNIWEEQENEVYTLITEAWNYNHTIDFADKLRFNDISSVNMALQPHLPVNDNISFELAGLNALMERTIKQRDAKLWSMFYANDGMSFHSFIPIAKGRKALDEYFEKHVHELPIFEKLDVRTDRIDELEDYVIEYATAICNWRSAEYSGINTSKNIRIWRREANGSLKIFRLIAMYD